ncbi:MAG: phosphoribosyl-ATP diphosphatase [Planctomycetota bacterium]|nr:phosphoribosyl-ATP diphosphatase [Planctomycetota bacterium]
MKTLLILQELMDLIELRRDQPPEHSYTVTLLAGGLDRIGKKISEEAAELVAAATMLDGSEPRREEVIHEAADLIYHLFVLLGFSRVRLDEVSAELQSRFGTSGLEEKASRKQQP